jgi:hypothetical protein
VSIDYLSGSNGHGTRQADAVRTDHRGAKNHGRCGVDRLPPMVFADTKRVESDLVGMLDVLDELPQPLGRITARLFSSNAAATLSIPICRVRLRVRSDRRQ